MYVCINLEWLLSCKKIIFSNAEIFVRIRESISSLIAF